MKDALYCILDSRAILVPDENSKYDNYLAINICR